MNRTKRIVPRTMRLLAAGLLALASVQPALASIDGDVRAGAYTDADAGMVGGGVLMDIDSTHHWYFNPNLEIAFPENADLMTVNGDFHYDFPGASKVTYWVGAGPALRFEDPEFGNRDTDLGANLLAGIGSRQGDVRPFGQLKVTIADDSEAVILFGVRF